MMAKYLGIPLTVSNGNKTPLTAQSELVDNGNFEDGTTDWLTTDATIAVVDGQLEVTSTASFGKSEQSVTTVPGKAYVVSAKVTAGTVPGRLELFSTPNILSSGSVGETVDSGYKIVSRSFVATSTTTTIQLKCQSATLGTALFDNVTLKEIAATETPTYGSPELVENSEFNEGNVDWTFLGVNPPSINNTTDTLDFTNSPTTAVAKTSDAILEKGKRYIATIDIESITSGALALVYSAGTYSPDFTSAGVYNYDFVQDGSLNLASIECYSRNASTTAVVNSIKVKEVPFVIGTRELVKNGDFRNGTTGWSPYVNASLSVENNKLRIVPTVASTSRATQGFKTEIGKTYSITASFENPNSSTVLIGLSPNSDGGSAIFDQSTASSGTINVFYTATSSTTYASLSRNNNDTNPIYYSDVSVVEIGYNYLQVADGGFTKSVKEGDVIFNTSTNTEGVVKQVIDNNVLLMSNDNFSTAKEFFNVFAANGDTRGNQIVRIDNYIMSEYDEDPSNPQESSFWYAGGVDADKVTLTHLVPATNTFFVADLIESYTERLNNQSATASRLDIPLDAFRDHKHNEVLTTTFITLS